MKKWGLVITLVYALIVMGLLTPAFLTMVSSSTPSLADFTAFYQNWGVWVIGGMFVLGQFVLLFLSVDTSQKRMRRRSPIVLSAITVGLFLMVVTGAILLSALVALKLDDVPVLGTLARVLALIFVPWMVWGVLFYLLYKHSDDPVTRAVAWLFRGSVLELLVAVPAHVIVRRRNECSAPLATGFGIASGIAIMLMSFGPSVLLLFKKRMEQYEETSTARE